MYRSIRLHQEGNLPCLSLDFRYIPLVCSHPDQGYLDQILYGLWYISKAVLQFFSHIIAFRFIFKTCDPLVNIKLLNFIDNIRRRDKCIHIHIHIGVKVLIDLFRALECFHSLIEHLAVKIISHSFHMTMLAFSQQISRPADLKVAHCDLKATSKVGKFFDSLQALFCDFLKHLILFIHEKRISSTIGTPDSSSQLIEL